MPAIIFTFNNLADAQAYFLANPTDLVDGVRWLNLSCMLVTEWNASRNSWFNVSTADNVDTNQNLIASSVDSSIAITDSAGNVYEANKIFIKKINNQSLIGAGNLPLMRSIKSPTLQSPLVDSTGQKDTLINTIGGADIVSFAPVVGPITNAWDIPVKTVCGENLIGAPGNVQAVISGSVASNKIIIVDNYDSSASHENNCIYFVRGDVV